MHCVRTNAPLLQEFNLTYTHLESCYYKMYFIKLMVSHMGSIIAILNNNGAT